MIMAIHLIAKSLFHNFSTLIIQHSFMAGLLKTSSRVIIHLLPLNHLVTVTNGSSDFILVLFLDWATTCIEFGRTHKGLLHEMPRTRATARRSTYHHLRIHHIIHVLFHILHHAVNSSEARIREERIIGEWISAAKRHHYYL